MAIAFYVGLDNKDWRSVEGGWACSALRLPAAKLSELRSEGRALPPEEYDVDAQTGLIVWRGRGDRPSAVAARVQIDVSLTTAKRATTKATITAVLAAAIGALGTMGAAYISSSKPQGSGDPMTPSSPQSILRVKSVNGALVQATESAYEAHVVGEGAPSKLGDSIYLIVKPGNDALWYVQPPLETLPSGWEGTAYLGTPNAGYGVEFEVFAVTTSRSYHNNQALAAAPPGLRSNSVLLKRVRP